MTTTTNNNSIINNTTPNLERPSYSDVASGRLPSPKLLHLERENLNSMNSFELDPICMDEDKQRRLDGILLDDIDITLNVQKEEAQPVHEPKDDLGHAPTLKIDLEKDLVKRILNFRNKIRNTLSKMDDENISDNKFERLERLATIYSSHLEKYEHQLNTLRKHEKAMQAIPAGVQQQPVAARQLKGISVNEIPIFRIISAENTLYNDSKNSQPHENKTMYPSLEAFFNRFEGVFSFHMPSESIQWNWSTSLRMSFLSSSELVYGWYKQSIESRASELSWDMVKKIIEDRFGEPLTTFQRGLRWLRMSPVFDENFADYVDRFNNAFDKLDGCFGDCKGVVIIFFDSFPKRFRTVLFEKITAITRHTSTSEDPFPGSWRETMLFLQQHKVILNNELKKVYAFYGNNRNYTNGIKKSENGKTTTDPQRNDSHHGNAVNKNGKRQQHDVNHTNHRQQRPFKRSANGSNAPRYAPHNRPFTNICFHCKKIPFSLAHLKKCPDYKNNATRNRQFDNNNRNNSSYNNRSSTNEFHTRKQ